MEVAFFQTQVCLPLKEGIPEAQSTRGFQKEGRAVQGIWTGRLPLSLYSEWGSRGALSAHQHRRNGAAMMEVSCGVHSAALWVLTTQKILPFGKMPSLLLVLSKPWVLLLLK